MARAAASGASRLLSFSLTRMRLPHHFLQWPRVLTRHSLPVLSRAQPTVQRPWSREPDLAHRVLLHLWTDVQGPRTPGKPRPSPDGPGDPLGPLYTCPQGPLTLVTEFLHLGLCLNATTQSFPAAPAMPCAWLHTGARPSGLQPSGGVAQCARPFPAQVPPVPRWLSLTQGTTATGPVVPPGALRHFPTAHPPSLWPASS